MVGTMAFTAGYWALGHFNPTIKNFAALRCFTRRLRKHIYGSGNMDPLRDDISLMSLEAKASRFYAHAYEQGCQVTNLFSDALHLTFPRHVLNEPLPKPLIIYLDLEQQARTKERNLRYFLRPSLL